MALIPVQIDETIELVCSSDPAVDLPAAARTGRWYRTSEVTHRGDATIVTGRGLTHREMQRCDLERVDLVLVTELAVLSLRGPGFSGERLEALQQLSYSMRANLGLWFWQISNGTVPPGPPAAPAPVEPTAPEVPAVPLPSEPSLP